MAWPTWVSNVTNFSHLALTFASSANFYIYFVMHSQSLRTRISSAARTFWNVFRKTPDDNVGSQKQVSHVFLSARMSSPIDVRRVQVVMSNKEKDWKRAAVGAGQLECLGN